MALVARYRGYRPALVPLSEVDLAVEHELWLEEGCELAGRLLVQGIPQARAQVRLDLRYLVPGVFEIGPEAFWVRGRLEEKHASAQTDEQGFFRIGGLCAEQYDMHVALPSEQWVVLPELTFKVEVPDRSAVFDLAYGEFEVVVRAEGIPTDATLHFASDGRATQHAGGQRPMRVLARPGHEVDLSVLHPSCRGVVRKLTAPAAGRVQPVTIDLQQVERPRLRLNVDGAQSAGLESVFLSWYRSDGVGGGGATVTRTVDANLFATDLPLDPGIYRLVVSGGAEIGILPREVPLRVPATGLIETRHRTVDAAEMAKVEPSIVLIDGEIWHMAVGLGGGSQEMR